MRSARIYVSAPTREGQQSVESATRLCSLSSAVPRSRATGGRSGPTQQSVLTIYHSISSSSHKLSLTADPAPGRCRPRCSATVGCFMRPEALADAREWLTYADDDLSQSPSPPKYTARTPGNCGLSPATISRESVGGIPGCPRAATNPSPRCWSSCCAMRVHRRQLCSVCSVR